MPSTSTYVIVVCSLAMERKFDDAVEVLFDMLGESRSPDHLTYKTVLEGLCREGRVDDAFELLDECKKRDGCMGERMHKSLLDELYVVCRE